MHSPFLAELEKFDRILLTGAGGGFDIYSGIPLYEYLVKRGKDVWYANLSFAELGENMKSDYVEIRADSEGDDEYSPERYLSQWYATKGQDVPVYAFYGSGARTILRIYEKLRKRFDYQALVLVDGGTDSLMRGDEPSLGSPAEDIASIAAAHQLEGAETYLTNLGFGVDYHHEVCHVYVLEAIADMTKTGDFLGAFSLLPGMPEFEALKEAVEFSNERMPDRASIVANSVVSAGLGEFDNYHHTKRLEQYTLFINPLMSLYWCFRLDGVAKRCIYLDYILNTHSRMDVHRALSNYLYTAKSRSWRDYPH